MGWAGVRTPGLTDGDGLGEEGRASKCGSGEQRLRRRRAHGHFRLEGAGWDTKGIHVLPFCHRLIKPKGRPWGAAAAASVFSELHTILGPSYPIEGCPSADLTVQGPSAPEGLGSAGRSL